jgi:hypothetical protein
MRIKRDDITDWKKARKEKPMWAKHISAVVVDKLLFTKVLFDTLEGKEPVGDDVMVCFGPLGDVWQQSKKNILKKYNLTDIRSDGWFEFTPKPDNVCLSYQVPHSYGGQSPNFTIIGKWGETVGLEKNVQTGEFGDYILMSETDAEDMWIVKRTIFENTYSLL